MPRHFDDWLKGYIQYTAASEAPDAFHFWTGVATIAGALRRRVWIDMRYFQWTPNFYIVFVGPPGVVTKSTALRSGMHLLHRLKIPFGPNSGTWQALTKALQEGIETLRYWDKTGVEVQIPISCITCAISELGTFLRMDDSSLIDVLVDLWDGQLQTWRHSTITSGQTVIENPWINIIACTTPSWIQTHIPEHAIGGGLVSRILFVYRDKKRHLVPYPSDVINEVDFHTIEEKLFEDLMEISTMAGEYTISPEAKEWGEAWYIKHHDTLSRPLHLASDRYGGYLSRKQTHIHKLAMVLSASRHSRLVVELPELKDAAELITSLEADMQKAFESIGLVDEANRIQAITTYVRAYGFLSVQDLWKLCMRVMSFREYQEAIRAAIEGRLLIAVSKEGKSGLKLGL